MAKQLLGKEVTAALNERIKADVKNWKKRGDSDTPVLSGWENVRMMYHMSEGQ